MTARPCLDCGELADATRCPSCQQRRPHEQRRGTATARGYGSRWTRLSTRARRRQPWCLWCGSSDELQTDHLTWPARSLDDVRVLCAPCHAQAPDRRGPNAEHHPAPNPRSTP